MIVFNQQGEALQTNSYYPFDMIMEGLSTDILGTSALANNYLYNGKKLDSDFGLEWYHYGFRMYYPQIARFPSLDPKAAAFPFVSPYNYAENDPIANIDLWGLQKIYYTSSAALLT